MGSGRITVFRWLVSLNPPAWAPEITWTHVSYSWVHFVAIKHIVTAYILLLLCHVLLSMVPVRRFFGLDSNPEQKNTTYIVSASILVGLFIWFIDYLVGYLAFYEGSANFLEAMISDISPRDLFGRNISLLICLISGLLISKLLLQRFKGEMALRESEKKYRTLLETTSEGCWLLNPEVKTVEINKSLCNMLGYSHDEMFGKQPFDFVDDENRKIFIEQTSKISTTEHRSYEITLKKKNGEDIHTFFNATTIRDESGVAQGSFAFITDITERKQAEKDIIRAAHEWQTTFDATNSVIWILDRDQRVVRSNKVAGRFFPQSSGQSVGKQCWEIVHGTDRPMDGCPFLRAKESLHRETIELQIGAGWFDVTVDPILDTAGQFSSAVHIITDITDRKQSEKEREKLQEQLNQAQKMESIGNLAGGIAHDFNNILSSVIGYTELALDEVEKDTSIEDNLQEVYHAGNRAKDLVKQILTFARQSDEKLKPIQVDIIVQEVLKFIRASIPTTIEIKQRIETDSLVMGNATQIHQILMNLCTNAAHAMEKGGGILEVTLKDSAIDNSTHRKILNLKQGNYIEIKVSDTGMGIAPEIIDSIFEPYFTTKGPGEGTGLGLAVVHGIVESCGGKITVDSKLENGTTFTIYLPITGERRADRPYESEKLPSGTESILFVDDEAPLSKMGSQILERLGYQVAVRTSSVEALELFRTKPNDFDLVITDMTMPNMTGDDLAIELMKIRPDIPVILCTGYSIKISDDLAAQIGIKAFAYKPVVKADLAKTVRKVLDEANG